MKKALSNIKSKAALAYANIMNALENNKGEGYIDTGVKIIIGVVVGGVVLGGLYALFNDTIIPNLATRIGDMFSYAG